MGCCNKLPEARRQSINSPAHEAAPVVSRTKEVCSSEELAEANRLVSEHFDILNNDVTLENADVIFFGEVHAIDIDVKRDQNLIRNSIVSRLASNKDALLIEGANKSTHVRKGETDPAQLEKGTHEKAFCVNHRPVFENGTTIAGWDSLEDQKNSKNAVRSEINLRNELDSVAAERERLKNLFHEGDDAQKEKLGPQIQQLGKQAEEIIEAREFSKTRYSDAYVQRNQSMIESIQNYSGEGRKVFVFTGSAHFQFDRGENKELFDSLNGKKVLYLKEKKSEGQDSEKHSEKHREKILGMNSNNE